MVMGNRWKTHHTLEEECATEEALAGGALPALRREFPDAAPSVFRFLTSKGIALNCQLRLTCGYNSLVMTYAYCKRAREDP